MTDSNGLVVASTAIRDIADIEVKLDSSDVEKYVATKFRKQYAGAIQAAVIERGKQEAKAEELLVKGNEIVRADAEARLKTKIANLKKGYAGWGATLKPRVRVELTKTPDPKTKEGVYKTYLAVVSYVVLQNLGENDDGSPNLVKGSDSCLTVNLKYPLRAVTLLKQKDEAAAAAQKAAKAAETLKREESTALTTARDRVGSILVEQRLSAVEGGEAMVEMLDNLTEELVEDVDSRLKYLEQV